MPLIVFTFLFFPTFIFGQTELERNTSEILKLHHEQRKFHFEKLPEPFAESLMDDVVMVNRGMVKRPTRAENIKRWQGYFDAVDFEEWDDTAEPIVRFSDDFSMAYVIVEKRVGLTYQGENEETNFAL